MTVPPSYRKVNPADAPVLFIALTSPSLEPLGPERLRRAPDLADAVDARRRRPGQRLRPEALRGARARPARRAGGAQHRPRRADRRAARGQRQHAGRHARGAAQTLTLQANQQLRNAAEFAELIVSNRNGNPVRLRDVAPGRGQLRDRQDRTPPSTARPRSSLAVLRQPDANTVQGGRRGARRAAELPGAAAAVGADHRCNDRSVSIRDALHDVTLTLLGTIVLVVLVIFLFLRRFVATVIPTLSLPVSLIGAVSLLWALRLQPRQHLAARPDAGRRPGGRRRDRDAREHHAPRRERRAAVPGGAARLARGRLHHHLDLDLAGRGLHPDLLHAGRDRPAVPRVRGDRRRWRSSSRRSSR